MSINWFPGHMHKARKEIKKAMSQVDVVIEVMDARIPFSSTNPLVPSLRGDKPVIKILNKADLADPEQTQAWQAYFEQEQHVRSLALTATEKFRPATLLQLCKKLAAKTGDRPVTAMIMGIPNVGKSTLINALAGKRIAKVGNEPAVTKRQQKIRLEQGVDLCDTPGILWPKLEPASCGYRLAATGAVKDTAMEYESVALFTLAYLRQTYAEALKTRYKLAELHEDDLALLEAIGAKRGCLRAGGVIDHYQAATIVLQDLRSGKLGAITLETPAMMEAEMAQLRAEIAARKAAKEAEHGDQGGQSAADEH